MKKNLFLSHSDAGLSEEEIAKMRARVRQEQEENTYRAIALKKAEKEKARAEAEAAYARREAEKDRKWEKQQDDEIKVGEAFARIATQKRNTRECKEMRERALNNFVKAFANGEIQNITGKHIPLDSEGDVFTPPGKRNLPSPSKKRKAEDEGGSKSGDDITPS